MSLATELERINSTRVVLREGNTLIGEGDYAVLYCLAHRGAGTTLTDQAVAEFARKLVPEWFTLKHLAEAASKINRFAGKIKYEFFSVAQHSCMVADICAGNALAACYALAHDVANEPFTNDLAEPVCELLRGETSLFDRLKVELDKICFPLFGLTWPMPEDVAALVAFADKRAFATELRDVAWELAYQPETDVLPGSAPIAQCWPSIKAQENFLNSYHRYAALAGITPAPVVVSKRRAG